MYQAAALEAAIDGEGHKIKGINWMSIWQISEDEGCVTGEGISNKRDKIAKDLNFE
ncbi:hypothetical protein [Ferrimonas sp. YFM]|uniref:hypothetical protein n=1 Tax=Ferrimonas sp. YFM TaxID=3028878 RepID=UPI0025740957|nr:hypothetical protein [Ferrimonas sp. YFM]